MACRTSFLSRQRDVVASFSFGAKLVHTEFSALKKLLVYLWNFLILIICIISMNFRVTFLHYVVSWSIKGSVLLRCARCREKGKGKDPCVELPESAICEF